MRRDVEAFLAAREHGARQPVLHEFPQDEFQTPAADFHVLGQRRRELDDAVIEERRAHFERMRHAHAVAFIQNIVGQVAELVQPQEPVQISDAFARQGERLARAVGMKQQGA